MSASWLCLAIGLSIVSIEIHLHHAEGRLVGEGVRRFNRSVRCALRGAALALLLLAALLVAREFAG